MGGGGTAQGDGTALGFLKNFLMGGTAGVISKTSCAPLERVKIVLQNQAALEGATKQYSGLIGTGTSIVKEQGVRALWRGNFVNCLRYFPTQAMNFAFKERYKKLFVPGTREEVGFGRWFAGYLAAGGAAGATSLTVAYPLEFAYTRLAADVNAKQFNGLFDCFGKIFQKEGFRGLYRGYAPSVCGIIVYRAGYFGIYDVGKQMIFKDGKGHFLQRFGLALVVDIGAACTAYPFDTVRRRLMMQSGRAEMQYTGAIQALKHIVSHEGVGGLYKGVFANNVRAIASALVLVLYDEMKEYVG